MKNREDYSWTEKYRPKTVDDTILPTKYKEMFQSFVNSGNVPDLILTGRSGVGKTSIARASLDELGCDYILINASLSGNIDTLRNEIQNFASSISLMGGRKYVIFDEADHMNPQSTQPALRAFMDQFSNNCGYIFTCNHLNRIIPALHSRCSIVDFVVDKSDKDDIMLQMFKRVKSILKTEKISFENDEILQIIDKFFPDLRRTLKEIQAKSNFNNKLNVSSILSNADTDIRTLLSFVADKNFTEARKWVNEYSGDFSDAFQQLYDNKTGFFTTNQIPELVILIAKYQYQAAFVANPEINFMAFIAELMIAIS